MTERGKYIKDYLTDGFFGGIDFENKLLSVNLRSVWTRMPAFRPVFRSGAAAVFPMRDDASAAGTKI